MVLDGRVVYLENWQEAGDLFAAREEQYHVFFYLLMGLILLSALSALAVSAWISRPLGRLSAAARQMAAGELSQRVEVRGSDEISRLSRDFNQMADQLEQQVQELTDTARRQEDFLRSFAHETKTPLTSIIGYAELVLSRPDQPELVQESAACIFREGRRLESLSRKLIDLIVLEKQGSACARWRWPLSWSRRPLCCGPGWNRRASASQSAQSPGPAEIEPDLMESVCLNLLDNARKAVEKEGLIRLEGIRTEGGYCIRVTDNGRGIPREELARITEPFYMVDKSRARTQGGSGLGLAICRRIVALHGGQLEFESELGRGTQASRLAEGSGGRMKQLRKWGLPLLTGAVVLAAVLLPRQISALRDRQTLIAVHARARGAGGPDACRRRTCRKSWNCWAGPSAIRNWMSTPLPSPWKRRMSEPGTGPRLRSAGSRSSWWLGSPAGGV